MADKDVTVTVTIDAKNNVGPAVQAAESQIKKLIDVRDRIDKAGGDSGIAIDQIKKELEAHQKLGGTIRGWLDGKSQELRMVEGKLRDIQGSPIGILPYAMSTPGTKSGIELIGGIQPEVIQQKTPAQVAAETAAATAALSGPAWIAHQQMLFKRDVEKLGGSVSGGGAGSSGGDPPGGGRAPVAPVAEKPEAMRVFVVNWPARGTGMSRVAQDLQDAKEEKKDGKTPAEKAREGFRNLQIAALAAAGAASAAVAATAPATWATFAGSLQLVSGEFANMLIPAFVKASYYLQQGADWVRSWDDSTKGWVSTIAVWSTGIVVGASVLSKFGQLIIPVARGLGGLAIAAKASGVALASLAVNPWVLGIAAGVAVVASLTNGFGLLGNSIERSRNLAEQAAERIGRLQQGGAFSRGDYESMPVDWRQGFENTLRTEAQRRQYLRDQIRQREAEIGRNEGAERLQTAIEANLAALENPARSPVPISERRRQAVISALMQHGFDRQQAEAEVESQSSRRNLFGIPGIQIQGLAGVNLGGASLGPGVAELARRMSGVRDVTNASNQLEIMRRLEVEGVPGLFRGISAARTMQPRTFSSGEQFYGDILQQMLGRGELEQRMFQQQMENDERLLREIQGLRTDVRNAGDPFAIGNRR